MLGICEMPSCGKFSDISITPSMTSFVLAKTRVSPFMSSKVKYKELGLKTLILPLGYIALEPCLKLSYMILFSASILIASTPYNASILVLKI